MTSLLILLSVSGYWCHTSHALESSYIKKYLSIVIVNFRCMQSSLCATLTVLICLNSPIYSSLGMFIRLMISLLLISRLLFPCESFLLGRFPERISPLLCNWENLYLTFLLGGQLCRACILLKDCSFVFNPSVLNVSFCCLQLHIFY